MKQLVSSLRDGWYGNIIHPPAGTLCRPFVRGNCGIMKKPAPCFSHIQHSIKECGKRIEWCAGIEGSILGGVTILPGYSADTAVPIDAIIDLKCSDMHNPNGRIDANVELTVQSDEVEEELTATSVDANADDNDVAKMLLLLAEATV